MNVKETFLKLTEFLIPYKQENLLEKYLPEGIQKDEIGNYYIIIGQSRTMFCCHMDSVGSQLRKVNHVFYKDEEGRNKVRTDGKTPLGGDDKGGMTILLSMIENKVPGCYYFFIGEEVGGRGSGDISRKKPEWFKESFDRCVAFDRKGYSSIISRQRGGNCCSKEFVDALSQEFANNGMVFKDDPHGIFTDSANFMYIIPECTNLSTGGFHEHTVNEFQNLDFLEKMCEVTSKIKWDTLPVVRKPEKKLGDYFGNIFTGGSDYLMSKGGDRINPEDKYRGRDFGRRSNKKRSIEQKKRPDFGIFNYKKYINPTGIDLYNTLKDYFDYCGYKEKSFKKRSTMVFIANFVKDPLMNEIIRNDKGEPIKWPKQFSIKIDRSNISIQYMYIGEEKYISYKDLSTFEKSNSIGFSAKFYKYVDSFLTSIRNYSSAYNTRILTRREIDGILSRYGQFTFDDIIRCYDNLFDEDDFEIRKFYDDLAIRL